MSQQYPQQPHQDRGTSWGPNSVVGNSALNPHQQGPGYQGPGYQAPGYQGPPTGQGVPPKTQKRWVAWVSGGLIGLLAGLTIGAAGDGSSGTPAANAGAPQPVVTKTVPGPAGATVTAPPVTVTKPAPPAKTVTAAPPQAAAAITEDGTYEVGVDIKPGKYKSPGGDGCYWARRSSLDGELDSIIANNLSDGPQTVTIKKSDKAFETARCGEWRKVG